MEARAPTASKVARGRMLAASLPVWVLAGALLGILVGLTFGERMAVLQPAGVVYAMLLESVVYPYILSSLIVGLGSLAPARTRELIRASWVLYLFLWIVVFAVIQVLAQAFPSPAPPIEIKPSAQVGVMDLLRTLIPENLTAALSRESRAGDRGVRGDVRCGGSVGSVEDIFPRGGRSNSARELEDLAMGRVPRAGWCVRTLCEHRRHD